MKNQENKLGYLNILRFLGAFLIAILLHWNDHVLPAIGQTNNFDSINHFLYYLTVNSYVFTEMFFIISGFLFAKIYIDRIKNNNYTLKKFMTSRYIRIFPLVIISSIVMYILHSIYFNKFGVFFSCGTKKIEILIFDILFAGISTLGIQIGSLNGPIWYIGPLMLCYILAYFLTQKYKKNNNYLIYSLPIFVGLYIFLSGYNLFILNTNIARGLIAFFTGTLIGNTKVLNYFDTLKTKKKYIIKSIMFIIILLFTSTIIFNKSDLYIGSYNDSIITYSLFFFPLVILFLYDIKIINKIGNTKLFKFLGNISYSIYIWNFPILLSLSYLIKIGILPYTHTWIFMLISFIIHILIASISYYLIEQKLTNKIKDKITY